MSEWNDPDSYVDQAHRAFEAGRWDDAEKALRKAISVDPLQPEWYFNLGLTLEAAGRFEDAAKAFGECFDIDREDAQAPIAAGVNLLRAGKPGQSIEWFEKAEKAERSNSASTSGSTAVSSAASWVHRIEAYARMGDHDQAEVMFYFAQEVNPKDAGAYFNLAESLQTRGLKDKALWCLTEAAKLDPRMPRVHARLADAYAATGRFERARQLYLKELRNDPGDIDTLLDMGCLLVEMNRPALLVEAAEKFRRVLELEPENTHALYYLADIADRQERIGEAIDGYESVLRVDESFAAARRRLAAVLLARAQPTDERRARELMELELAALATDPEKFLADDLEDVGRILLDAGMNAEAARVLTALTELRPASAQSWHLLSLAYYQASSQGNVKDDNRRRGIAAGRRAVHLDRTLLAAVHNLAMAYAVEGDFRRSQVFIRRGLKLAPGDAALRRLRSIVRLSALLGRSRTAPGRGSAPRPR